MVSSSEGKRPRIVRIAVKSDGKAVGLVANGLDQVEDGGKC